MSTRLEKFKKFKADTDNKELEKKMAIKMEREDLIAKVRCLKPRIDELIETANECIEYGICINEYGKSFNYYVDEYEKGTFVTNGWSHKVGFIQKSNGYYKGKRVYNTIKYIGIDNGGANGCYDFRTDGYSVQYIHEKNEDDRKIPSIYDLKKFLNGFDEFEKKFYEYVDKKLGV